jgi:hypothetical protein
MPETSGSPSGPEPPELSRTATKVSEELRRLGVASQVREMPESTRTAQEAAAAGTPRAVFSITPSELVRITSAVVAAVAAS